LTVDPALESIDSIPMSKLPLQRVDRLIALDHQRFEIANPKLQRSDSVAMARATPGLPLGSRLCRSRAAAEWLPDLRAELLAFPTGKHDDIVDALGLVGQLMDKFAPGRLLIDNGYSREIDVYGPPRDSFMTL
jgi:hypothetical protein